MRRAVFGAMFVVTVCGLAWLSGCEKPAKLEPAEQAAAPAPTVAQPPEVVKVDATAGKAIYDKNCARCHRLGSYDPKGKVDLAKHRDKISRAFISHHRKIEVSQKDTDNLKAFVAQ